MPPTPRAGGRLRSRGIPRVALVLLLVVGVGLAAALVVVVLSSVGGRTPVNSLSPPSVDSISPPRTEAAADHSVLRTTTTTVHSSVGVKESGTGADAPATTATAAAESTIQLSDPPPRSTTTREPDAGEAPPAAETPAAASPRRGTLWRRFVEIANVFSTGGPATEIASFPLRRRADDEAADVLLCLRTCELNRRGHGCHHVEVKRRERACVLRRGPPQLAAVPGASGRLVFSSVFVRRAAVDEQPKSAKKDRLVFGMLAATKLMRNRTIPALRTWLRHDVVVAVFDPFGEGDRSDETNRTSSNGSGTSATAAAPAVDDDSPPSLNGSTPTTAPRRQGGGGGGGGGLQSLEATADVAAVALGLPRGSLGPGHPCSDVIAPSPFGLHQGGHLACPVAHHGGGGGARLLRDLDHDVAAAEGGVIVPVFLRPPSNPVTRSFNGAWKDLALLEVIRVYYNGPKKPRKTTNTRNNRRPAEARPDKSTPASARYMHALVASPRLPDFFTIVDDDSWMFVETLRWTLQGVTPDVPLQLGLIVTSRGTIAIGGETHWRHVAHRVDVNDASPALIPNIQGGAGIVSTRGALEAMFRRSLPPPAALAEGQRRTTTATPQPLLWRTCARRCVHWAGDVRLGCCANGLADVPLSYHGGFNHHRLADSLDAGRQMTRKGSDAVTFPVSFHDVRTPEAFDDLQRIADRFADDSNSSTLVGADALGNASRRVAGMIPWPALRVAFVEDQRGDYRYRPVGWSSRILVP